MEYKVKYIGPESMFSHPAITRIGKQPYLFVGEAYTNVDNEEDFEFFKRKSGSFAVLENVTEATAVNARIETPKTKIKKMVD